MTTPILLRAIDRFISTARDGSAADANGRFRHFALGASNSAATVVDDTPSLIRALLTSNAPTQPRGEAYVLRAGGVRLTYFAAETPFEVETEPEPDHLSVRYVIHGKSTYSMGDTVIATAGSGDYTFRFSKSPLIRLSASDNYSALLLSVPIPTERRFSIDVREQTNQHIKQYLKNGFIAVSRSSLWSAHLAYVLHYALEDVFSGVGAYRPNSVLNEFLYLLCTRELAAQVQSRDVNQQYTVIPLKLKIAENFVIANAAKAPSVEDVAAVARLSVRSLHALFVKFRGASPSEFIREQRLTGIRSALRSARNGTTVSEIAIAWNYQNFGNFAATYRKRFGEFPSETLGCAERRATRQ